MIIDRVTNAMVYQVSYLVPSKEYWTEQKWSISMKSPTNYELRKWMNNPTKPTDLSVQDTCDESRFSERSELKLKLRFASNVEFSHLLFHVSFWDTKEAASWN